MKLIVIVLVLLVNFSAHAIDRSRDSFDLGCLSWEQVRETFDLSQISADQRNVVRAAHTNARRYLIKANSNFSAFRQSEMVEKSIMLCSFVDEATQGFEYQCLNDSGEELISQELIESCLSMRLAALPQS